MEMMISACPDASGDAAAIKWTATVNDDRQVYVLHRDPRKQSRRRDDNLLSGECEFGTIGGGDADFEGLWTAKEVLNGGCRWP